MVVIRRPRLDAFFDAAAARRLTAIVAGPGNGKTTALSQWASERRAAWYGVPDRPPDLARVTRAIIDELRLLVPGLSGEVAAAVEQVSGAFDDRRQAEALAATLSDHLEDTMRTDVALVIDDAHRLTQAPVAFLDALCRQAPRNLHVILTSREAVPFPIARMRAEGDAVVAGAEMLAFTRAEAEELVDHSLGRPDGELARRLLDQTGGWPVAVALAMRSAIERGVLTAPMDHSPSHQLFEYLADEVLEGETEELLGVLRVTAHLPWVDQQLLDHLGFGPASERLFPIDGHMFLASTGRRSGSATLSPLFRAFVRKRHPLEQPDLQRWARMAAEWYERQGALTDALAVLDEAGLSSELVSFLEAHGRTLLASGAGRDVIGVIDTHASHLEDRRELVLLDADARRLMGDTDGALRRYRRLTPPDGPVSADLAWRLGLIEYMRGDASAALETFLRGAEDSAAPEDRTALAAWMASAHWLRGEKEDAARLARRALDMATESNEPRAMATAHTVLAMAAALDGDRSRNDHHYLLALDHAERARDVLQTIRIRSNRGSHFLEQGDFDRAEDELEVALGLADLAGLPFWRGLILTNRGTIHLRRGRLDEAASELDEAAALFRSIGSALEAYPLGVMGRVHEVRGNTALAQESFSAAVDLTHQPGDQQALVPALAGLARVLADRSPVEAVRFGERAAGVESVIDRAQALNALAVAIRATGDMNQAASLARTAGAVARERRDRPGLAESLEIEASTVTDQPQLRRQLLLDARDMWEQMGAPVDVARVDVVLGGEEGGRSGALRITAAADVFQRVGAKRAAVDAHRLVDQILEGTESAVTVKTLGGFAVSRGGVTVPVSEWQSRVARLIVAMLVAARGRPLHREVLIERLWPDEGLAAAGNRLSVALSTIRKVFDPTRSRSADHHLIADRETVSLDHTTVAIDLDTFLEETTLGERLERQGEIAQSMAAFRWAEARYVGDFMEEEPDAEWARPVREDARGRYLMIAEKLADAADGDGRHDEAARLRLRMLERDPYDEAAHLGLVRALVAAGRHGTARRQYASYVTRMDELSVDPVPFPSPAWEPNRADT